MKFIEAFQKLVGLIQPTPAIRPVPANDTHRRVFLRHKDYAVEREEGARFAAPTHTFHAIEDFAEWVCRESDTSRWAESKTSVLVDRYVITVSNDDYNPHNGIVSCALDKHPYWKAWVRLDQRGFIGSGDLLEELRMLETTFGVKVQKVDGQPYEVPVGPEILNGLRTVEIHSGGDVKVERDAGGMVTFRQAGSKTDIQTGLPNRWNLRIPVYAGAPDIEVDVEAVISWRVTKTDKGGKESKDVQFRVRLSMLEVQKNKARAAVVQKLRALMPAGVCVAAGHMAHLDGRYS